MILRVQSGSDSTKCSVFGPLLEKAVDGKRKPPGPVALTVPLELKRKGRATRLVLAAHAKPSAKADPRLVRLLVNAERERRARFAQGAQRPSAHQVRLARLAYLAPDITAAILEGRQPAHLASRALLKMPDLPMDWREQHRLLGVRAS